MEGSSKGVGECVAGEWPDTSADAHGGVMISSSVTCNTLSECIVELAIMQISEAILYGLPTSIVVYRFNRPEVRGVALYCCFV